jgi:hypothetical protein
MTREQILPNLDISLRATAIFVSLAAWCPIITKHPQCHRSIRDHDRVTTTVCEFLVKRKPGCEMLHPPIANSGELFLTLGSPLYRRRRVHVCCVSA